MGCFDTVIIRCPKCSKQTSVQSKAGACDLRVYKIELAPPAIVADIAEFYSPVRCDYCSYAITVRLQVNAYTF